jgi:hypothetical protein
MKRTHLWLAALAPLVLAACGPNTVQVTAEVEVTDPISGERSLRPIENLEIELLPFDRDIVLDSLAAAAPNPEPGFPMELQIMQDSLFAAQEDQREAESEWLALRERLQQISREMRQFSPAEGQYRVLFNEFNDLESRVSGAERRQNEAFRRVEDLQSRVLGDLNEARILQENWEDEAFADYFTVMQARLQESRGEIQLLNTDGLGQATFSVKGSGAHWVHARYRLPSEELYWNIRVEVGGDPVQLRLTRENAEVRRAF